MLVGHEGILERFRRALSRGRLASTFLFVGPAGVGKRTFALHLAQSLLCERVPPERLAPCGQCPSCQQVRSHNHPDVDVVARPADKAFLPLELLIGDAEHRMRAGLCYNIALRPYSGRRKIAIIDDADSLNKEGANCLLKTLEEPPPQSVLILIGTSEQRQLPTIRSRCQTIRFQPLSHEQVSELLVLHGKCDDRARAEQAARLGGGSLEQAAQWCQESLLEFRREFLTMLSRPQESPGPTAKRFAAFVDEAGKESIAKRQRLRLIVSLAEHFYRVCLLLAERANSTADAELQSAASSALRWMPEDAPAACLDVCLEAHAHIEANVNQATFIDWWLDALAEAGRPGRIAI